MSLSLFLNFCTLNNAGTAVLSGIILSFLKTNTHLASINVFFLAPTSLFLYSQGDMTCFLNVLESECLPSVRFQKWTREILLLLKQ